MDDDVKKKTCLFTITKYHQQYFTNKIGTYLGKNVMYSQARVAKLFIAMKLAHSFFMIDDIQFSIMNPDLLLTPIQKFLLLPGTERIFKTIKQQNK